MSADSYAIFKTTSRQHRVSKGDTIQIDITDAKVGDTIKFDQVLAHKDKELVLGTPLVAGATVTGTVTEIAKGKKTFAFKHRKRKTHRKKTGHRQQYMTVKIDSL